MSDYTPCPFQAAWDSSRLTFEQDPQQTQTIQESLNRGKYVLIEKSDAFCTVTDAKIGHRIYFVEEFETLEPAIERRNALLDAADPETDYEVLKP